MDYNINDFVRILRGMMYNRFPYESNFTNDMKHVLGNTNPKPLHIRYVAFKNNETQYLSEDLLTFDIGNEIAEKDYPYYHILQDSPVIKKKGKANKEMDSQANIKNLGQRNYNKVKLSGKMFYKERDTFSSIREYLQQNATRTITIAGGKKKVINRESDSYYNRHYHYIEKMLDNIIPIISSDFGLKYGGIKDNGLAEEFLMDNYNLPSEDIETTNFITQILNM